MSDETKHTPISDVMVEFAATAVAADHYAKRFGKTKDDPHVLMNVSGNWHIFAHDARIALEAAHSLPSAVTNEMVERACSERAVAQWEASLNRPDLDERARVIGAISAYARQAFALSLPVGQPDDIA